MKDEFIFEGVIKPIWRGLNFCMHLLGEVMKAADYTLPDDPSFVFLGEFI